MVCMQTAWHVLYGDRLLFQRVSYPLFCHLNEITRKFTMKIFSVEEEMSDSRY
jgi:hypothetical protein